MQLLCDRIRKDGVVLDGDILKVSSFLNHQMDVRLLTEIGKEFKKRYDNCNITKILTIEASGIGVACIAAQYFDVPVVFAKKNKSANVPDDVYTSKVTSYTKKKDYDIIVSKEFLQPGERVLIIDDFLATGSALEALLDITSKAGAEAVGCGIVIEKAYQPGGELIRSKGVRVESLARIKAMSPDDGIEFC